MHRVARSLATAGCTKASSAARLAAYSLRSASVVRPPARLAAAVGASGAPSRRTIHVRVPLPYKIEDGLGDFLSPEALKVIAEDYQQGLLDRLNEQIKGTKYENMPVAQIVISTAPHESQTLAFNYASLALNNSFFLHHLKPPTPISPNHEAALSERGVNAEPTQTLAGVIASQMGSLQDLKTYVNAAATGMLSSSGFVWLVTDALGHLGVVATYGAGTLLVSERRQTLSPDGNTELGGMYVPAENPAPPPAPTSTSTSSTSTPTPNPTQPTSPASGRATLPLHTKPPQGARALSTTMLAYGPRDRASRPANLWSDSPYAGTGVDADAGSVNGGMLAIPDGSWRDLDSLGRTLYPLFCVSVHEHAWMAAGYGVWGKEKYLERFWTCLDWAAVRDAYAQYARPKH